MCFTSLSQKKYRIIHSPRSFPAVIYNFGWCVCVCVCVLLPDCFWRVLQILKYEKWCPLCEFEFEIKHHTGEYVPYSLRTVYKFFNVPRDLCMQGLWDGAYGLSSLDDKVKLGNTVLCLYPVIKNVFHIYCKVAGVTILSLQSFPPTCICDVFPHRS